MLTFTDGHWFSPAGPKTLNIGENRQPGRIADGELPDNQQAIQRWFDPDAFVARGVRLWGNSRRNVLYGPGMKLANASAHRSFSVSEAKQLPFRADFFNVTNTPQFNYTASSIQSPTGGWITRSENENRFQRTQRPLQFGLRFVF